MYNNNNPLYQQNSSGQQPLLNPQYQDQNQQVNQQFAQQNYQQYNQLQNQNQNAQYNPPAPQNQIMCFPNGQQILDPALLYCQQSIRKRNICDDNSTAVTNLMILLQLILAQLPLRFTFLQVAGNSNIYSSQFYEEKIIRPLITENTHVNEQIIRNSYVAYCSQILSQGMKSYSIFVIATLLVAIGYLAGMNLMYFNNKYSYINSIGSVNIIYICQIVFIIINLILFIFATLKSVAALQFPMITWMPIQLIYTSPSHLLFYSQFQLF
ncbi:transmembrane protein, putative (macronuclear) [Tetrahymena thermophila SB210]|uniref:Transmembrane protein, putative n=1 Tax=Tetrahymena thermophila (strain SB210) TaxID=312017 RepID=I7M1B2_TETTS|nr:transmembrane protein, putative [Tetrahymena thermophila SB210]EAR95989.2 transmembrane protein, putative [Tetrahymena thermophila SB210]|eukprot:XP_001016234.2 transmembrane protein, putative [Tetrahymena thermophila SB210]